MAIINSAYGFLITCVLLFGQSDCQCTLPLADGTWLSSIRGTWTVSESSTKISGFTADLTVTLSTATLQCAQTGNTDTQYILTTNFEIFAGLFIDVYTCLDIRTTDQSPNSYVAYTVTPVDSSTGEKFTSDITSVCSNTGYEVPTNIMMIVLSGSEAAAGSNCPDVILGNYSTQYTDSNGAVTSDLLMDSCNDTKLLNFDNLTTSGNLAFTSGNLLQCVFSVTSGSDVYVFTYNSDSSVDGSSTYRFACWVFAYGGPGTVGTAHPEECLTDQTSVSVAYPGHTFTFNPYFVCPLNTSTASDDGLPGWAIALIVLSILLILLIIGCVVFFLTRKRCRKEDETPITKGDSSPEDIPEDDIEAAKRKLKEDEARTVSRDPTYKLARKKEEGYDSVFDDKQHLVREKSFELFEVKKGKDNKNLLKAGRPMRNGTDSIALGLKPSIPEENVIKKDTDPNAKDLKKNLQEDEKTKKKTADMVITDVTPGDVKESTVKQGKILQNTKDDKLLTPKITKEDFKKRKNKDGKFLTPRLTKDDYNKKKSTETMESCHTDGGNERQKTINDQPIVVPLPDGKRPIAPTTPKPAEDDTTLIRIVKERERKEKEKQDKKKKKAGGKKQMETDTKQQDRDSEKEQRVTKIVREDSSGEEYETDESEREERKQKLLEKRRRLQGAQYVPPDGVTDATVIGRKRSKRRGGDQDTDDLTKTLVSREDQEKRDKDKKHRKKMMRSFAKQRRHPQGGHAESSNSESDSADKKQKRRKAGDPRARGAPYMKQYLDKKDLEAELDDMDYWQEKPIQKPDSVEELLESGEQTKSKDNAAVVKQGAASMKETILQDEESPWDKPLPDIGIEIGENGQLPEGYYRDNEGNIVRESDGEIIATADVVKLIELKKRMNVFGLPRLVRNTDGRPLGGYKDDIFGPTAEWDWGDPDDDIDDKKSEHAQRATSGKQVGFATTDNTSTTPQPMSDLDYSQIKGRQLGPAERELLQKRLFEQKLKSDTDSDKRLPIHFVGKKNGLQPDAIYIEKAQVQRLDSSNKKPKSPNHANASMIMRSDTFEDGRIKDSKRQQSGNFKRNTKYRATWSVNDSFVRDGIPEETEMETLASAPKKRNIGSDDEFVVVPGQHFGYAPTREETLMSDFSMRTAPDSVRPFSGDGYRYRRCLGELYKDQKYFQYYLDTEKLPTKAAQETRGLAGHGLEFLNERAAFWNDQEPSRPPPSELALRLSRMQTLYTIADSGMDSAMSADLNRPRSADDADGNIQPSSRLSKRENTRDSYLRHVLPQSRSDLTQLPVSVRSDQGQTGGREPENEREPPTGRSEHLPKTEKYIGNEENINNNTVKSTGSPKKGKDKSTPRLKDTVLTVNNIE